MLTFAEVEEVQESEEEMCTEVVPFQSVQSTVMDVWSDVVPVDSVCCAAMATGRCRRGCWCPLGEACLRLILDTGASRHVASQMTLKQLKKLMPQVNLQSAFGEVIRITESGQLHVSTLRDELVIDNILSCSNIGGAIILSIERLIADFDFKIEFTILNSAEILSAAGPVLQAQFDQISGNYVCHCADPTLRVLCQTNEATSTMTGKAVCVWYSQRRLLQEQNTKKVLVVHDAVFHDKAVRAMKASKRYTAITDRQDTESDDAAFINKLLLLETVGAIQVVSSLGAETSSYGHRNVFRK